MEETPAQEEEKLIPSNSSSGSSFEEEAEGDPSGITDLQRNLELMRRRELIHKPSFRYEQNGVVVYDASARNVREDGTEILDTRKIGLPRSTRLLVEEFIREDEKKGVRQELDKYSFMSSSNERMLYRNMPSLVPGTVTGQPVLIPIYKEGLEFSSAFESGNLQRAIRVSKLEYELWLAADENTKAHIHWFFFRVRAKLPAGTIVRFRILNLIKPLSLYTSGLRPFARSRCLFESCGLEWTTTNCSAVSYYQNTLKKEKYGKEKKQEYYYTLDWKYEFAYENDEVYFAQFPPYTYTQMLEHLQEVKLLHEKKNILRVNVLCSSLSKNICPVLTITDNISDYLDPAYEKTLMNKSSNARKLFMNKVEKIKKRLLLKQVASKFKRSKAQSRTKEDLEEETDRAMITADCSRLVDFAEPQYYREHEKEIAVINHLEANRHKRAVVITARVHPGEVPSSWIMQGIIEFLCSDTTEAKLLRQNFVFKLIPMLNPDGVVLGNYRCSLLGFDLNRKWKAPSRYLQPTIHATKSLIRFLAEEREIALYLDLHAHSMKKNIFMYGCMSERTDPDMFQKDALIRVLPLLLSQQVPYFSYSGSRFRLEKNKEATARIVVFKEFGVANSYTCESSFYGASYSTPEGPVDTPMSLQDFLQMGKYLAKLCLSLLPVRPYKVRLNVVIKRISRLLHERYMKSNCYIPGTRPRRSDLAAKREEKVEPSEDLITKEEEEKAVPQKELEQIDHDIIEELSENEEHEESEEDASSTESEQAIQEILQLRGELVQKKQQKKRAIAPPRLDNKLTQLRETRKTPNKSSAKEYNPAQSRFADNRQKSRGNSRKVIFSLKTEESVHSNAESPLQIRRIITKTTQGKPVAFFPGPIPPPKPELHSNLEPQVFSLQSRLMNSKEPQRIELVPGTCIFEELVPAYQDSKFNPHRLPPSIGKRREVDEIHSGMFDLSKTHSIDTRKDSAGLRLSQYQASATYSRQAKNRPVKSQVNPIRRSKECDFLEESHTRRQYMFSSKNNHSSKKFMTNFVNYKQSKRLAKLSLGDNSSFFHHY